MIRSIGAQIDVDLNQDSASLTVMTLGKSFASVSLFSPPPNRNRKTSYVHRGYSVRFAIRYKVPEYGKPG